MNNFVWGLLFLNISFFQCSNATDGCNDDGWTPYSDEKCIKVFQHTTTNFDEAEAFCTQQMANGGGGGDEDDNEALKSNSNFQVVPRLLTIDNADQQVFVEKLLFGNNSIDERSNIWLGGRSERRDYHWRRNYGRNGGGIELDKEGMILDDVFTNWQSGYPVDLGNCIEMITKTGDEAKKGQWVDEECANRPKSQVVCERPQLWPAAKLQEHLIKLQQTVQAMRKG